MTDADSPRPERGQYRSIPPSTSHTTVSSAYALSTIGQTPFPQRDKVLFNPQLFLHPGPVALFNLTVRKAAGSFLQAKFGVDGDLLGPRQPNYCLTGR
jgi:hypothetical protein